MSHFAIVLLVVRPCHLQVPTQSNPIHQSNPLILNEPDNMTDKKRRIKSCKNYKYEILPRLWGHFSEICCFQLIYQIWAPHCSFEMKICSSEEQKANRLFISLQGFIEIVPKEPFRPQFLDSLGRGRSITHWEHSRGAKIPLGTLNTSGSTVGLGISDTQNWTIGLWVTVS